MKPKNQIIILTLLLMLSSYISYGQENALQPAKQLTIIQIDSICNSIDNDKNLVERLDNGVILEKKKTIGKISTYELINGMSADTLFRIRQHISFEGNYIYTYYYFEKTVIKARLDIEDRKTRGRVKTSKSATYYFHGSSAIKIEDGINNKYSTNSTNILIKGLGIQKNFYKLREELNKLKNHEN